MPNQLQEVLRNNSILIGLMDKVIFYIHTQNYDQALRITSDLLRSMDAGMGQLQAIVDEERFLELNDILEGIFLAQNSKDYVLQADLFELRLRRYFLQLQEDIIASDGFSYDETLFENNRAAIHQIDPELCELIYRGRSPFTLAQQGYEAEFSSSGLMTAALTDQGGRYYLHSNSRAGQEAFSLASSWYHEDITHYIVYGYGFGYHIKELMQLDSSIHIEVYESDLNILKLAAAYTRIGDIINHPAVQITYDPGFTKIQKRIEGMKEEEERLVLHYPSLRNVRNRNIKEKLEDYFIQYSSLMNQKKLLDGNYRENILHYDEFAEELKEHFSNKDLYIIAAGPSLDKNFHLLKEVDRRKGIILATGTVFRKLFKAGIIPDYFIVTDANERVYYQIAGLEEQEIPMLFLSTAYRGFAQNYRGKKYIILQQGYEKAEAYAKERNTMTNKTGGSVSTTALDLGIALGCRRIIFLGLDLAYTGDYRHASDTSMRELTYSPDLRTVTDVNGDQISTAKTLDMYRQWIERRISDVKGIEFIDATEGGARVAGMKCRTMEECVRGGL